MTENQKESNEVLKQASRQLNAVISVTKAFIQYDFFKMLEEVLSTITHMIRGKYGAILLVLRGEVELIVHTGNPPESLVKTVLRQSIEIEKISRGETLKAIGLAAQTVLQEKTLIFDEMNHLPISEAALKVVKDIGITNLLSTPIIYHNQVLGVIQLARTNKQTFTSQEIELVESFSRELGLVITEKAASEVAEEAQRDLEFFIDLLTHDISSQAMIVFSCLEEIREVLDHKDEDTQFFVQSAMRSLERVQTIIDQVKMLSVIKELGIKEFNPIDLCGVIERSIEGIKSMFPDEKIEINFSPEKYPVIVHGTHLLDNCITNIMQNAVLADDNPVKKIIINLDLNKDDSKCRIEIIDHGQGIPDELKEKIFLRFFRARTKSKGSGLGLYITKKILEKHNGTITVKDRIEGDYSRGSCFILTLDVLDVEEYTK